MCIYGNNSNNNMKRLTRDTSGGESPILTKLCKIIYPVISKKYQIKLAADMNVNVLLNKVFTKIKVSKEVFKAKRFVTPTAIYK